MKPDEESHLTNPAQSARPDQRDVSRMRCAVRIDPFPDDPASRHRQQVSQSRVLEILAQTDSADAIRKTAQTAIWNDRGRLYGPDGEPRRCLWDLPEIGIRGWPPAACGGPRSCDGTCSRIALHGLQSWLGALQGQPNLTGFGHQISGPPIGYLLPGPVWHASVSSRFYYPDNVLEERARAVLDGVGNATLGEWVEIGNVAIHLRRRLTSDEEHGIEPRISDDRGTPEGERRFTQAWPYLSQFPVLLERARNEKRA